MSSQFLPRARSYNRYGVLTLQRHLLEQHFPLFRTGIINNVLIATGWLRPTDCRDQYKVKIEYKAGKEPKSTVLSPIITPSAKIHMYSDHSLCLSYRPDMRWTNRTPVYQYTVPWISEWIVYYEIYQMNGGFWEGPESPFHMKESDKNENFDKE